MSLPCACVADRRIKKCTFSLYRLFFFGCVFGGHIGRGVVGAFVVSAYICFLYYFLGAHLLPNASCKITPRASPFGCSARALPEMVFCEMIMDWNKTSISVRTCVHEYV